MFSPLLVAVLVTATTSAAAPIRSSSPHIVSTDATLVLEAPASSLAPTFVGSLAFGDYDNDGDLDLLLTGSDVGDPTSNVPYDPVTYLYRNDGNFVWTDVTPSNLPKIWRGYAYWGDYNNDNHVDILFTGQQGSAGSTDSAITAIYGNNGDGTFTLVNSGLPTFRDFSNAAWGDFNNDGRLDVVISGRLNAPSPPFQAYVGLYRNNGDGTFTDINAGLLPLSEPGTVCWGDFDSDGDLDLVSQGLPMGPLNLPGIYRNNWPEGTFTLAWPLPIEVRNTCGSLAAADYDLDGQLDIFAAGCGTAAHLLRNNGDMTFSFPVADTSFNGGAVGRWGDVNNDGRPDIMLPGGDGILNDPDVPIPYSVFYRNVSNESFVWSTAIFPGLDFGDGAWADMDNDGDLDGMMSGWYNGYYGGGGLHIRQIEVVHDPPNALPSAPTGLASTGGHRLTWDPATDTETPSTGLTYNVRVGTTPGGCDIVCPMADPVTGYRRVVGLGNVQRNTWWTLDVPPGTYYWSVQAIDGVYAGGPWADEQVLTTVTAVATQPSDGLSLSVVGSVRGNNTRFNLRTPRDGHARLELYDVGGRRKATLLDADILQGEHTVSWPTRERANSPSGVYFARLQFGGEVRVVKAVKL